MNELYCTGIIDKNQLDVLELNQLNNFLTDNNGKKFTLELKVVEGEISKQYLGYYWLVVIPKMQKGFKTLGHNYFKKESVDRECRKLVGLYYEKMNDDLSGYTRRLKTISELDTPELREYIEALQIIAAEYMSVYIQDPNQYNDYWTLSI